MSAKLLKQAEMKLAFRLDFDRQMSIAIGEESSVVWWHKGRPRILKSGVMLGHKESVVAIVCYEELVIVADYLHDRELAAEICTER